MLSPNQGLVVGTRGLQLPGRVLVADVDQTTVGLLPQARYAFVDGMVDLEVLALQVSAALPAVVEPDKAYADVVLRAFADQEGVACQAAGLVDQGRGGWPACVVEHGVVQRRQDALEHVSAAHNDSSLGNGAVNGALGAVTRTGPLQAVGVLNTANRGPGTGEAVPVGPLTWHALERFRRNGRGGTDARPRRPPSATAWSTARSSRCSSTASSAAAR